MRMDLIHPNVPKQQNPVYWSLHHSVGSNVANMQYWIDSYAKHLPEGAVIDEVSVLSGGDSTSLDRQLRMVGGERFNAAEDVVYTSFGTRYVVHYDFWNVPGVPWRLEVMRLMQGFSPIHKTLQYLASMHGILKGLPVPHLSFKPVRRTVPVVPGVGTSQTWQKAYGEAVRSLGDSGALHLQTCQSTYGTFSYWIGNEHERAIYLKPRINLRDEGGQ